MIEFASPFINGTFLKKMMGWGVLFAPGASGVVKNKNNLKIIIILYQALIYV